MWKYVWIYLCLIAAGLPAIGQEAGVGSEYPRIVRWRIDSLQKVLENTFEDTVVVNVLNQMSRQYRVINEFESFIKAQEALEKASSINYGQGMAESYMNLGFINNEQGLYDQAIEMYQKGLEVAKKHQIHKAELYCLNGIGIIYWEQQKYQKALEIFQANLALQKNLGLEKESAASYNNIGLLYNHLHEYEKALYHLFRAKAIREKNGDEERNIATYNNIGIAYLGQKQYDTALNYSLKSLKLAKTFFQKRRIKEATLTIAQIYEAKGDFKNAHSYLKEHKALLDSLEKQDKASIIAEIKRKQDVEARESQISILQQNHRLKNIIYALAIIFLLVVIVISGFRAKKSRNLITF